MIRPDLADLVLIAAATLSLDTSAALDLLDVAAAETALAEAATTETVTTETTTAEAATADAAVADTAPAEAATGRADRRGHRGDASDPAADAAAGAAAVLHALIRHRPFRRGNEQIAVVAALQFLTLNGWHADLDPPEAARSAISDLAAGRLTTADFAAWLSPRLSPDIEPIIEEAPMRGWLPGRKRTARRYPAPGASGRLTGRARRVVALAHEEARGLHHNYVGTEHILLGLLREGDGVAARALGSLGITAEAVRQQVEEIIGRGKRTPSGHVPVTPRVRKVLELSLREAMQLDHLYIGTEHILLGMLREGEGLAAMILAKLGAQTDQIRHAVVRLSADHERPRHELAPPPGLGDYDEKIAAARRQKDAAIDAKDFDLAAGFRDTEKQLLAERDRRITEWSAGVDVAAMRDELERLHHEVARLQNLLLKHGIQPDDGAQQTA